MGIYPPAMLLVPLVASLAGVSSATVIPPAARPPRAAVHEIRLTAAQQRDIVRYWTVERMIHAISPQHPPQPRVAVRPRRALRSGTRQADRDLAWRALAAPAQPEAAAPSGSSSGALWPARGAVRDTTGKVFFSLNGRDYLCSASTVASANHDLVVTAGHCAKDGAGAWAEKWIFVPGYHEGTSPYGVFTARKMYVPDRWSGSATDDRDVAMVALDPANGRHVMEAAGAQAIAFGRPRGGRVYAFGYPAMGQYDGERLAYCSGMPHSDPHGLTGGQGLRCDMTQGSSGGAWLSRFDPASGRGVIISVSSFKYADDESTMYGPYFGDAVHTLYDQAQRG